MACIRSDPENYLPILGWCGKSLSTNSNPITFKFWLNCWLLLWSNNAKRIMAESICHPYVMMDPYKSWGNPHGFTSNSPFFRRPKKPTASEPRQGPRAKDFGQGIFATSQAVNQQTLRRPGRTPWTKGWIKRKTSRWMDGWINRWRLYIYMCDYVYIYVCVDIKDSYTR